MVGLTLLASCKKAPVGADRAAASDAGPQEAKVDFESGVAGSGLTMRLFSTQPAPEDGETVRLAEATWLDDVSLAALLKRMPTLEGQEGDRAAFALREGPQPPPRTGATVQAELTGDTTPAPAVESGPLTVLRHAPDGDIPMAPHLSVTFSQPMVAVTSQDAAAMQVPITLTPTPKGQWRWLGTKTVVFEPDPRFPMATQYRAEVPAGTRSATGGTLEQALSWTFTTPSPKLLTKVPEDSRYGRAPQPLTPVIVLGFDQAIDPAAVRDRVVLEHGNDKVGVRLASDAEIAASPAATSALRQAEPGRAVALVPSEPLRMQTSWRVLVPKGTPSAEGPRSTPEDQSFTFTTYGPLGVSAPTCWTKPCPPDTTWTLPFTNPLDVAAFDPASVTISPTVPGFSAQVSGSGLALSGMFTGRTTYTLSVSAGIKDQFGQALAAPATFPMVVGPADPSFSGPDRDMVVVDPAGTPQLSFFTVNESGVKVRIYRVTPEDWPRWQDWNQKLRWQDKKAERVPGTLVATKTFKIEKNADERVETVVDLRPWLDDGYGQLLVFAEPAVQPKEDWARMEWMGWVQSTHIGLTAFVDHDAVVGWANRLADGANTSGLTLSLLGQGPGVAADAQGLARLPLGDTDVRGLVARAGKDVAFLPSGGSYWSDGWMRAEQVASLRWHVFNDKQLYKPGETAHIRGWTRVFDPARQSLSLPGTKAATVRWSVTSSQGNPMGAGEAKATELGGFTFDVPIPATPNLGTAWITLVADNGESSSASFDIQEYRTPEFEVSTSGGDGVYALGEEATVDVAAKYFAGGGLASAEVAWRVSATPSTYAPPNHPDYNFGPWSPWWAWWEPQAQSQNEQRFEAVTDASGAHHLGIHFTSLDPVRPMTVTAEATVQDVNRQAWTSAKSFLVHPASVYVGVKTSRPWVEAGAPIDVHTIRVDRDGVLAPGTVSLRLVRREWKHGARGWSEVEIDEGEAVVEGAEGKATLTPKVGGSYAIIARTTDPNGRPNQTEVRVYVNGLGPNPDRGVESERVTLVPDKKTYGVGDTASLLVQSPFWPAEAVLTVRAGRLLETRRFTVAEAATVVTLPITEAHMPDLTVAVDVVGARTRSGDDGRPREDLPKRVSYGSGNVPLEVSTAPRTLGVRVKPAVAKLDPGKGTGLEITVTDPAGKAVPGAELVVVAVDEAVLSLTGYRLPDPITTFYAARGDGVRTENMRQWLRLVNPNQLPGGLGAVGEGYGGGGIAAGTLGYAVPAASAPMEMMDAKADFAVEKKKTVAARGRASEAEPPPPPPPPPGGDTPIAVRSDFSAVALWAPVVVTDSAGTAKLDLKLPDSLTRYRIMVVAAAGTDRFGQGEADVTARLPLMVRPSPPRFLNFGDRAELPVVVQNQTDQPMVVDVALRATNLGVLRSPSDTLADALDTPVGKRVTVPANDRVEVRFPTAADQAGVARIQLAAASGAYADAAELSFPVWTPATTEAFATYGTFDQGAIVQPVAAPSDAWPEFGGLEVSVSSTQLQALTDSVLYLARYPYDCNEQRASRVLGIASMRDVLTAFGSAELPSPAELERSVDTDLAELARRQNSDGGWAFWRRGDPSWPYLGVHVTHALVRAQGKGYAVDDTMMSRAMNYTKGIERHIPSWYSKESRWTLRAYALHVQSLAGKPDVSKARALFREAGTAGLGAEGLGFLLPTLADGKAAAEVTELRGWLANHVTESAAGAHFTTSYSDGAQVLLHSDRVADGVLLEAMLRTDKGADLIPKLVNGLLAHRTAGRWTNTTENAHILLAMDRYFRVYESVKPDFVARVWLQAGLAGEHTFKGHTTERAAVDVPMDYLQGHPGDVTVGKEGPGRLYYRIGLRYAPKELTQDAADRGFAVARTYTAVDDPADVSRDADGTWRIKAGARVRVKLTMVTPMRRYHVALVDPLPAGLEVLNPDLATTGAIPVDPSQQTGRYWWWTRTWYEHENLRDERVEAFASLLYDGVFDYTYVARATTPGDFVVPPAKAEEMYAPETFGRSASDRVVVQ